MFIINVTQNLKKVPHMKKSKIIIIPSAAYLIKMKKEIMKIKGMNLANLMYKIGESAGNDFFEHCVKDIKGRENKIKKIFEILNLTDYGKYELKNMSKKHIIIRITQSPLTKLCSQNKKPSCHWTSGLLSGLFNNLNKGWLFETSKCKKLGYSYCEFRGKMIK